MKTNLTNIAVPPRVTKHARRRVIASIVAAATTLLPALGQAATTADVIYDMTQPNGPDPAYPHGVPAHWDWRNKPILYNGGKPPVDWEGFVAWGGIHRDLSQSNDSNTRIEISNIQAYFLSRQTGLWTKVQDEPSTNPDVWREEEAIKTLPYFVRAGWRQEPGGTISVKLPQNYLYHFWAPKKVAFDAADLARVYVVCRARLIVDNPNLPDDRHLAKYMIQAGADWWRHSEAEDPNNFQNNAPMASSRFTYIRNDWVEIHAADTQSLADLNANPPPGVTIAGSVSQVSAPVFSPAPGTYTGAQNVTITSATSGATIRYTTNGTTPTTTNGIVYAGPVNIGATTTLKAIAYKSGLTNSNVTTGTYTINTGPAGIVGDPGFENQTSSTVSAPWALEGRGGIDRSLNTSRSGLNNGWTGWQNGWNALIQRVPVAQNTNYTLTGYVQTSSTVIDGYFGVRNSNNSVLKEVKFGTMTAYTPLTVSFNSGANTSVIVFAGHWINNVGAWMHLDDVSLTAASTTTLVHGAVYRVSPKIARASALDVLSFKTFDGDSFVGIWQYIAATNQKWKAYSVGSGYWEFEPQHELGARLDVRNGSSLSQTDVWTWTRNGGKAQRWKPIPNSDGSLSLEPECAPGTRLDVKGGATANGTRVWIYTNNNGDAQRWFFQAP
jgi:hypothetical protein